MAKYVKTEDGQKEIETTVAPMVGEKMDKNNPVGTGSFSMGRKPGSVIGASSHAEGSDTTASGVCSHAEGSGTTASGNYSHVEGKFNIEDTANKYAHIIGNGTSGFYLHNCFMVGWDGAIYVQASDDATKMMKLTIKSDGTISAEQVTV